MIPKTKYEELREEFLVFHRENKDVWVLFQKFTWAAVTKSRSANGRYPSIPTSLVLGAVRWSLFNANPEDKRNIPGRIGPFYARMWNKKCPEMQIFRTLTMEGEEAFLLDQIKQVPLFPTEEPTA